MINNVVGADTGTGGVEKGSNFGGDVEVEGLITHPLLTSTTLDVCENNNSNDNDDGEDENDDNNNKNK